MTPARPSRRPLVTVVMPIHDRFALARRALESIYGQTHRPVEAIVVDDASSPPFAPPSVADSKGVEVRVRRIDENVGPGAAREAGRRLASGEYIAYLDSDDAWHPQHLAGLVGALDRHSDADMSWAPSIEMHEGDERALRRYNDEVHERILPALLWGRPWHTSACLWRRTLSDGIGPWKAINVWRQATLLQTPKYPWELLQMGNCGSPIETPEGWLVITHGVGPVREYVLGVSLLDLENPEKEIGRYLVRVEARRRYGECAFGSRRCGYPRSKVPHVICNRLTAKLHPEFPVHIP